MPENVEIITLRLQRHGYEVITAIDGADALDKARALEPDLILLDIMMPKLDGIAVTRRLKEDTSLPFIPIVLLTAKIDAQDIIAGLDAGSDDYLTKPIDHGALVARVRAMLRIKELHDKVHEKTQELALLNGTLEARVADQVGEIRRISRLKRFLAPQVAEMIVSAHDEGILQSHRRDIAVLFCDLRGFTAFAENAQPEEVMGLLREYHQVLGPLVHRYEGTLGHFQGDGLMVFFNDPLPCPDAAQRAVMLALSMHDAVQRLAEGWCRHGWQIGFGVGIAQGIATLGQVGFEECVVYTAIGTVANTAARLSARATGGQTLVTAQVAAKVNHLVEAERLGSMMLRGLGCPIEVCNILQKAGGTIAPPASGADPRQIAAPNSFGAYSGYRMKGATAIATPYLEKLMAIGYPKRIPVDHLLVREGDNGGQLFLIVQGSVRAFSRNEAGREVIYGAAGAGDVIGEMALDGGPRSANVVALTNTDVVVIEHDALLGFVREHPEFAFELIGRIIRRARIAMNSTRSMVLLDAYGRLIRTLEAIALPARPDGVRECTPVSQMELASRAGCSREMVGRLLNDLAHGGYVEISRRRIVLKRKFPERW